MELLIMGHCVLIMNHSLNSWSVIINQIHLQNSFTSKLLKAHKGSGCPQNSKAERESEFWLDRILMGIHEEFPWLKNRGKTIPENLLVFPEKRLWFALLKTWWVFCSHTMESTVRARNIFYANRSFFYSNRKLFFRPP